MKKCDEDDNNKYTHTHTHTHTHNFLTPKKQSNKRNISVK